MDLLQLNILKIIKQNEKNLEQEIEILKRKFEARMLMKF